jgi:GT2 family glycosyltransferase/ubiquinone/menaquinone biosynthesis C-methylase UbiE
MDRCSIVIPVHNRASLTRDCLDRLLGQDLDGTEIVVVDDASTDETPELLASHGDTIKVVTLPDNRGFASACNAGVGAASGRRVVLLNNDTRPEPGWLRALADHADAHPGAGLVGARLLWPDETVQHAGVVIDSNKDVRHVYMGFPAQHPAVNKARQFQVVTAACVLIEREVFEALGGFDSAFVNGYEDVDFCLRAREQGHEVHYCPDSVVYHLESVSRGYETEIDARNRELYKSRWADRIGQDDVLYYVEDGLLELRYDWLSVAVTVSPELGWSETGREENTLEGALAARSRQCWDLMRENARLQRAAGDLDPWARLRAAEPSGAMEHRDSASPPPHVPGVAVESERFVPEAMAGVVIEVEHQARYMWAAAAAPGRTVLDAGCGVGYGTAILAQAAGARTVGVDISPEAVAAARNRAGAVAEFVVGDLHDLPFEDDAFQLVTCFEAIEHAADPDRALDEIRRVMAPDGLLLISSPNRNVYRPGNPYHVHEYVPEELEQALAERFGNVRLYRQQSQVMSMVGDDAALQEDDPAHELDIALRKLAGGRPGEELYTMAAASDDELPDLGAVALAGGRRDLDDLLDLQAALAAERERTSTLERKAKQAYDDLAAFRTTRRYRLAQMLGRPLDILRGGR